MAAEIARDLREAGLVRPEDEAEVAKRIEEKLREIELVEKAIDWSTVTINQEPLAHKRQEPSRPLGEG